MGVATRRLMDRSDAESAIARHAKPANRRRYRLCRRPNIFRNYDVLSERAERPFLVLRAETRLMDILDMFKKTRYKYRVYKMLIVNSPGL